MAEPKDTTRRELMRLAALCAAAFAAGCGAPEPPPPAAAGGPEPEAHPCLPGPDAAWLRPSNAGVDLPHLGGAPDDELGWAVAAFVDTVVPGAHRDPTGAPGGIDVGAPALFFDPALPAQAFLPALVSALDMSAGARLPGRSFPVIAAAEREQVLGEAVAIEAMELAIQLAKLAYYASAGAGCHLGYPGPNPGYFDNEDMSFGVPMAEEITVDGNYP
ncbi:MAG: hypothetical protein HY744_13845 [Deltaproteobacteria bacterium]|nr:hypothetical protein [Deltaproteobacteria bacterium]